MKLAAASQAQLQSFLRYHLNDETLMVPAISIYKGNFARIITRLFKNQRDNFRALHTRLACGCQTR